MTGPGRRPLLLTALFSAAAALLFVPLFIFGGLGPLDFWWGMSFSILLLAGLAFVLDVDFRGKALGDTKLILPAQVGLGILSAAVLYFVFLAGEAVLSGLFSGAQSGIASIYGFKAGAPTGRIVALLGLIIGPGEEVFWRGFLQRRMEKEWGGRAGWLAAAALYTAVHLGSGNPVLVLAAAVCGLFWGFIYLRYRSLVLNALSHTLWDLAVFVLWPLA